MTIKTLQQQRPSDIFAAAIAAVDRMIGLGINMNMFTYFMSHQNKLCSACLAGATLASFVPDEDLINFTSHSDLLAYAIGYLIRKIEDGQKMADSEYRAVKGDLISLAGMLDGYRSAGLRGMHGYLVDMRLEKRPTHDAMDEISRSYGKHFANWPHPFEGKLDDFEIQTLRYSMGVAIEKFKEHGY